MVGSTCQSAAKSAGCRRSMFHVADHEVMTLAMPAQVIISTPPRQILLPLVRLRSEVVSRRKGAREPDMVAFTVDDGRSGVWCVSASWGQKEVFI